MTDAMEAQRCIECGAGETAHKWQLPKACKNYSPGKLPSPTPPTPPDDDGCTCQFNDCAVHGRIDPEDHEELISSVAMEPTPPTETQPCSDPEHFWNPETGYLECETCRYAVAAPTERVETSPRMNISAILGDIVDRIDMAPNDDPLPYIREHVMRHIERESRKAAVAPSPAPASQDGRLDAAIELLKRTIPFTECDCGCDCERDRLSQETVTFLKAGKP